jgi:outer membrane protein OmpA-like peptidoglycan-associated protein
MTTKIYAALLFLSLLTVMACSSLTKVGKADKHFAREEFEPAIKLYLQALKKKQTEGELNYKLAESYRRSNRIQLAEPYYKAALDNGYKKEDVYLNYGLALRANGKYNEASSHLTQYAGMGTNQKLLAQAKQEVTNLSELPEILNVKSYYDIKPMEALNSEAADFGVTSADGELVFSSTRGEGPIYKGNGLGFTDLYAFKPDNAANPMGAGAVRKLDGVLNKAGIHEATATYSKNGKTVIFARGNEGTKKGRENVDLFVSSFRGAAWTEPRAPRLNKTDAWDSTPFLSADGKTLYFASDRKGGQGGTDIYKCVLDENGNFSAPENMGAPVNTAGNESFPAVGPEGTFYFSSDGHTGLGKLDLYKLENDRVVNLGTEINSTGDDFGIYPLDANSGYFSSERAGGKGSDDIYYFIRKKPKLVNFFVDVNVREQQERSTTTKAVTAGQRVVLQGGKGAQQVAVTDATGKVSFKLDTASSYSVLAERNGYFAARQPVVTQGRTPAQSALTQPETDIRLTATLTLVPIVKDRAIVVENIFYDLDKADIRPDAALELDKLVQTLNDNPKITIELSSHTDVRGKDAYNLDLSDRRAKSAVAYIISKGIAPTRITARGYGETRLVVKNAKTEPEHQRNRRTEFKVTRIAQ